MKFDVLPTATVDLIPVQICLHLATEMKADTLAEPTIQGAAHLEQQHKLTA